MIKRKPVGSPFQTFENPSVGFEALETSPSTKQPDNLEPFETISRKPVTRSRANTEQLVRGFPDLSFIWSPKPQSSVASEFSFFWTLRGITSTALPVPLRKLAIEINPARIKRVFAANVGPECDSYAAWRTTDGEYKWILRRSPQPSRLNKVAQNRWLASRASIATLDNWLAQNLNTSYAIRTARVVLGPDGSYFAKYSPQPLEPIALGQTATWGALSSSFRDVLNKRAALRGISEGVPVMAALGLEGAWVAVWPDKEASWDLAGKYDALARELDARDGKGIESIFLSPTEPDQFYVQFSDRVAFLAAPILRIDLELLNACLISKLLYNNDTPPSPSATSPTHSPLEVPPIQSVPSPLTRSTTSSSLTSAEEPFIIPCPPPGQLYVSVISDRNYQSPYVSLPTIPPIPPSKLKFCHFAKGPEHVRSSATLSQQSSEGVAALLAQAAGCPVM